MAKATPGIRISELAKELGVESKTILAWLKSIDMGDVAHSHNSSVKLGLAMTIREEFSRQAASNVAVAIDPDEKTGAKSEGAKGKGKTTRKKTANALAKNGCAT